MANSPSPMAALRAAYESRETDPVAEITRALDRANGNPTSNTYIALDPDWSLGDARRQRERQAAAEASLPLYGVPVSLKDCFDLAGFPTSTGSRFYAAHLGKAPADSWVAARLRQAGAVITGKTHLHQLAYGITGENPDYGDCVQPRRPERLTGGSSSGAAASVQEGSALAAIGTDTGGSVRVPAALCGLAGYRASLGLGGWAGGYHLSATFDTIGWLFQDLRDAPPLARALFDLPPAGELPPQAAIGVLSGPFFEESDAVVKESLGSWKARLQRMGAELIPVDPSFWGDALDIYVPIQAHEAAQLHAGFYEHFDPQIASRLAWGASLSGETIRTARERLVAYRAELEELFQSFDFLLAPATPVSQLPAGADHTEARARILRHTTPASLGGLPTVVLPSDGCGVQLMAAPGADARLLRFAEILGEQQAAE